MFDKLNGYVVQVTSRYVRLDVVDDHLVPIVVDFLEWSNGP